MKQALVNALRENRIRGAALDVFQTEPLPLDHPLRSMENVVLTPHMGYVTDGILRSVFQPGSREYRGISRWARPARGLESGSSKVGKTASGDRSRSGKLPAVAEAFDAGAHAAEFLLDALVPAVDVIDAVDVVVLLATRAASTSPALARRSDAVTGAPLNGVGPVTMATLPSIVIFAPMRIISLAWM